MKRSKRLSIICCIMLCVAMIIPTFASATTYSNNFSRGGVLAGTENYFIWATSGNTITAVDKWQKSSGLCHSGGIVKLTTLSNNQTHKYNCTSTFLIGAVVGGVTLGFQSSIIDRCHIYYYGTMTVDWDI